MMRKSFLLCFLLVLSASWLLTACVQRRAVYVQSQPVMEPPPEVITAAPPPPQAEVIVASPGPQYVWTPGNWSWQGRWVWIRGSWVLRPHPHAVWVPGRWVHRGHGHIWIAGHWR